MREGGGARWKLVRYSRVGAVARTTSRSDKAAIGNQFAEKCALECGAAGGEGEGGPTARL